MSKSIRHTTRCQGLRLSLLHVATCILWNYCTQYSMHKVLTIETTRKNFRIAHSYSISNSYSISKWRVAAACSLCQRLHITRTPFIPLYVSLRGQRRGESVEASQRKPRRAFSNVVRIKDPMFTRTWSSETTATHNASNNRDYTRICSAHPRTFVTPTIHWECGVLCK